MDAFLTHPEVRNLVKDGLELRNCQPTFKRDADKGGTRAAVSDPVAFWIHQEKAGLQSVVANRVILQ